MTKIALVLCNILVLPLLLVKAETLPLPSLLPKAMELAGWQGSGSPQHMKGEDLFLLINGGAEIYHEYGFVQVIAEEYTNDRGKTVNLELFEMKSAAAAFGMYTFKSGGRGQELAIGQGARFEDYYLNFWKDRYLVTLTGFDAEAETKNGIIFIARLIDRKIETRGGKPDLLDLLPKENLKRETIKYLRGNLALFNLYEFARQNIFALEEGVIAGYGDSRLFIFKYKSSREAQRWYKNAISHLLNSPTFTNFTAHKEGAHSMTDKKGRPLFLQSHQNHILILLGKTPDEAQTILREMIASWSQRSQ